MTYSRRIGFVSIWVLLAILLAMVLAVSLATPKPAEAAIHEIIAALCNGRGETVPPGQVMEGQSFVRALQATGFIESIDFSVAGEVTVNFDVTVPNSKFTSAGVDLTIDDGFGPGVDLILSPLPVPDPGFAAHANCPNFAFP